MPDSDFDPYRKWLGIPPREQPPDHYRLLGINRLEDDPDVIEAAADRQMAHLRTYQSGKRSALSQKLLNEVSAARLCLLDPKKKEAYDAELRERLDRLAEQWQPQGRPFGVYLTGAFRWFRLHFDRFRIHTGRLQPAYAALGEHVFGEGTLREQLPELHEKLDAVDRDLAGLDRATPPEPPDPEADRPSEEPAPAAKPPGRVGRAVRTGFFGHRQRSLLRLLGREAYLAEHGAAAPAELLTPIHESYARLEAIRSELAELARLDPGELLSPRRLAWIIIACAATLVLLFAWAQLML